MGKVYQRDEIAMVAELCKKHNVLIISDDVYEHMVRNKNTHYSLYKILNGIFHHIYVLLTTMYSRYLTIIK